VQAPSVAVVLVTLPGQTTAIDSVLQRTVPGSGQLAIAGGWNGRNLLDVIVVDGT